jgi:two-component system, sensor histidine kinase LadS
MVFMAPIVCAQRAVAGAAQPRAKAAHNSARSQHITMRSPGESLRFAIAALFCAAGLAGAVQARPAVQMDMAHQPVALQDAGEAWIDESGEAAAEQLAADSTIAWKPAQPGQIYHLTTGKALWFRFSIAPTSEIERWYVEVPYPSVDRVTLYMQDNLGDWTSQAPAGDTLPVAEWPVPHRHPLLPILVTSEQPRNYLLKVENPHSFSAPIDFVSDSYLSREGQQTALILGIYFGLAGLAALLGLISAVSLRDPAYAFYALSVALMGLAQAGMTGIAGLHLWPHQPWWNDRASMVVPVLAVGCLMWFFATMVSMRERSPWFNRIIATVSLLAPVTALGIMFIEPSQRFRLLVGYVVLAGTMGTLGIIWAARRGDRYALWLLVGSVPVMIGSAFPTARVAGLIPVSFLTTYGMQVGIAFELPILLVILMLRSQQRREHWRRIQGLDRTDPATGLMNEAVFMERLVRMIARSQRLKFRSAVILVDIVNTDAIRRQFGPAATEELPLQVAGRLLAASREIDGVARLSEYRFGMLIEGPLNPEDIASAGPRVVARCLMPFKDKPLQWLAQVRVAQTLVPAERADPQQIVARLQGLLSNVPAESKRAVFSLTS